MKKIGESFHLHLMAEGTKNEEKAPIHGGQKDVEVGFHGLYWVWLLGPCLQLFPPSPGLYC